MSRHRIQPPHKPVTAIKRDAQSTPAWPSFQGDAQLVGTSPSASVTVYVDSSLGQQALQNAQDLLNDADRILTANDGIFGTTGGAVSAIVFALNGATDGTGGADHNGCDYTTGNAIEVDASYGNSARVSALFEAELSECSMNGNLCGVSTGEALSRWCAAVIGNNALADFATAPQWVADGMGNWVDQTEDTDQDADSIGCGMAFLSWLISQGYGLEKIAPAMVNLGNAGTLAQLYASLTGDSSSNAWNTFGNAINALPNGSASITTDDPFNRLANPTPMTQPAPRSAELVGRVLASMFADLAGGHSAEQIAVNVRAAMAPAARSAPPLVCPPKSKRLLPPRKAVKKSKSA